MEVYLSIALISFKHHKICEVHFTSCPEELKYQNELLPYGNYSFVLSF